MVSMSDEDSCTCEKSFGIELKEVQSFPVQNASVNIRFDPSHVLCMMCTKLILYLSKCSSTPAAAFAHLLPMNSLTGCDQSINDLLTTTE